MRLSRGKINHISRLVAEELVGAPDVDVESEPNAVRLAVVRVIEDELRRDELVDLRVRQKIESQKREIPEGGREWEILYRQYYQEELEKTRPVST
jgi:hypothetical protein